MNNELIDLESRDIYSARLFNSNFDNEALDRYFGVGFTRFLELDLELFGMVVAFGGPGSLSDKNQKIGRRMPVRRIRSLETKYDNNLRIRQPKETAD